MAGAAIVFFVPWAFLACAAYSLWGAYRPPYRAPHKRGWRRLLDASRAPEGQYDFEVGVCQTSNRGRLVDAAICLFFGLPTAGLEIWVLSGL